MPRRTFNILRRHLKADRLLSSGLIVMRACSFCRTHNFFYVITPESSHCERYFRSHLECELAPLNAKAERLFKEEKRLVSEITAAYAKITRFRKQHRAVMKKLRDLDNRKDRNIFELKIDEIMISDLPEIS
jgi:hemerythrin